MKKVYSVLSTMPGSCHYSCLPIGDASSCVGQCHGSQVESSHVLKRGVFKSDSA